MQAAEVITILRAHEAELKAAGIVHLSLFGSTARGDQGPESDVDLMIEYDDSKMKSLLTLGGWIADCQEMLGVDVDISPKQWMRERVRKQALKDAIDVF